LRARITIGGVLVIIAFTIRRSDLRCLPLLDAGNVRTRNTRETTGVPFVETQMDEHPRSRSSPARRPR
jgi:hypothetical protein